MSKPLELPYTASRSPLNMSDQQSSSKKATLGTTFWDVLRDPVSTLAIVTIATGCLAVITVITTMSQWPYRPGPLMFSSNASMDAQGLSGVLDNSALTSTPQPLGIEALSETANVASNRSIVLLPLGDSITFGSVSPQDTNGYRLKILNLLTGTTPIWEVTQASLPNASYQHVTTVGWFGIGNFTENHFEGWPGFSIKDIKTKFLENSPKYKAAPNLVLLHAGTNDLLGKGFDPIDEAPERLSSFIDAVYGRFPKTTIIVACVTPFVDAKREALKKIYNANVTSIVEERQAKGQKIFKVDMSASLTAKDINEDGVHPNEEGYEKMAYVWYQGVLDARKKGILE